MRTVWKIEVPVDDLPHDYEMPPESRVVHVACQGSNVDVVSVWFECEDGVRLRETRQFIVYGTGHPVIPPFDTDVVYVGTAVTSSGFLVWHVFEHQPIPAVEFGGAFLPSSPDDRGPTLAEMDPNLIQHLEVISETYGLTGIRNACQAMIDTGKF